MTPELPEGHPLGDPQTSIDTFSGRRLDFLSPQVSSICVEDVAAGLSKVCRFGGQSLAFYSVAQHAVLVQRLVIEAGRPDLGLAALHHDSHEAYACDIPKPLKRVIAKAYEPVTDRLDEVIAAALGLPSLSSTDAAVVKRADDEAFETEALVLLNRERRSPTAVPECITRGGQPWPLWTPPTAFAEFLEAHRLATSLT